MDTNVWCFSFENQCISSELPYRNVSVMHLHFAVIQWKPKFFGIFKKKKSHWSVIEHRTRKQDMEIGKYRT